MSSVTDRCFAQVLGTEESLQWFGRAVGDGMEVYSILSRGVAWKQSTSGG